MIAICGSRPADPGFLLWLKFPFQDPRKHFSLQNFRKKILAQWEHPKFRNRYFRWRELMLSDVETSPARDNSNDNHKKSSRLCFFSF